MRAGLLLLALAVLFTSSAAAAREAAPEAPWLDGTWAHERSDLKPHPNAVWGRLDNGFRYVLLPHDTPKGRVAMQLDIQAGSLMERDDEAGIAHYMEHMVFNGSRNFPPGKLIKYFQENGMSFGGDTNAHTSLQETVFKLDLPEVTDSAVENGLRVLADFAMGALVLEKEVDNERGIILEEKTARDTTRSRAWQRKLDVIFDGTRFVNPTIGTEAVIKGADAALLRGFYDAWYRPELTVLVMVGDIDPKVVEPMVRWAFADFRPRAERRAVPQWGNIKEGDRIAYYDPKSGNAPMVMVETIHQRDRKADTVQSQRRELAVQVGTKILRDRLMRIASGQDAPCLKAFTHVTDSFGLFGDSSMMAICKDERWQDAVSMLEQELRRATTHGFTPSEIESAKRFFATAIRRNIKREQATPSMDIAAEIVTCLNEGRVYQSAKQSLALYGPMLETLTEKDVEEAFNAAWSGDRTVISLTGLEMKEAAKGVTPENSILEVWNASAKESVGPWKEEEAIIFPYLDAPEKPAQVISQQASTDLPDEFAYTETVFDNGVRLLMKPVKAEKNKIEIGFSFGEGTAYMSERDQRALRLAAKVLNMTGAGKLTRSEMVRMLEGKSIRTTWQARPDSMCISASCLAEDSELAFNILRAMLLDQHVRQNDFASSLALLKSEMETITGTATGVIKDEGMRFLGGGSSYLATLSPKTAKDITLEDIREILSRQTKIGPLTICIAGDFDPAKVSTLVATLFADVTLQTNPKATGAALTFPSGKTDTVRLDGPLQQAGVMVAYPLNGLTTEATAPDAPEAIEEVQRTLLARIVSDRLRIRIREELGAAYSPFASLRQYADFDDFGVFYALATTDGGKTDLIKTEMTKLFEDLVKEGITEEELSRARRQSLTGRTRARRRTLYWRMMLEQESHSRPGTLLRMAAGDDIIRATTAEELTKLAQKTFKQDQAAIFTVLPAKTEN